MKKYRMLLTLSLLLFLFYATNASAGGPNAINAVNGAPRTKGMGGAGMAVTDNVDAAAFQANPALLAYGKNFVQVGTDYIINGFTYKNGGRQIDSEKAKSFVPLFGIKYKINDRFALGIGCNTPNVFLSDFKDSMGYYSKISLTNIAPALAFRVTENFAVGISAKAGYGKIRLMQPMAPISVLPGLVVQTDTKADGWGYSGQVGLLWKAAPWLNLGAMYQSKTKVELTGHTNIQAFGMSINDNMSGDYYFAGYYSIGGSANFGNWLIALDVSRSDYSSTDKVKIDYDLIPNRTIILDWQNNLIVDFGVEYKLSDAWRLRAGLGYQDRVVPESTMSPAMPDMNGWSVGTGVGYQWKDFTFDLSYVYAHGKERWIIDADHGLAGRYSADIHIVSAAVKYNF